MIFTPMAAQIAKIHELVMSVESIEYSPLTLQ